MENNSIPRTYEEWRKNEFEREEDAANNFGFHVIIHCREAAIEELSSDLTEDQRNNAINAIDTCLHNIMDLLEVFFPLLRGNNHNLEYIVQVAVVNKKGKTVEKINISPNKLDLPIGYWKWARDKEFR